VSPFRATRAAFVFLTRIPVGGFPYTDAEWRWAPAFFPLVGLTLGAALGEIDHVLQPLGALAAALATLAVSMFVTGAFHEDGLADTSDALGGAFDRDKILVILKDSRIGAFGAAALFVSIVGRAVLLARLGAAAPFALAIVGMSARAAPVWQIAALPYVSTAASRSRGVTRAGSTQAIVATGWALAGAAAVVLTGRFTLTRAVAMAGAMAVVVIVSGIRYARRLGGFTGDFLGATEQLCELAGYAALAWGVAS
jgi:adenosylcobinamide-GDP ribazoletransferase